MTATTVKGWGGRVLVVPALPPVKEDAACCVARALPDGRLPIGFCSPGCVRRRRPTIQEGTDR